MIDLKTTYLGMDLKNPLVASASPLGKDLDMLRRMEDAGCAAVVLHSLFEEQIEVESNELDRHYWSASAVGAEAMQMFPELEAKALGPQEYLDHIRKCKQALRIPVIASLNGVSPGGWTRYAKLMEQAGADALELNVYLIPTRVHESGFDLEHSYVCLVEQIKQSVNIPVAVKLGSQFTSFANVAKQLDNAGADALVIFNRFYQPDLDLENLEVVPSLVLSRSHELNLRLHWTAILFGQVGCDIAITGGVHTAADVLKSMMAGANISMMTSAILEHGPERFRVVLNDLAAWMQEHEYESIRQMQGSMSLRKVPNPQAFERANYVRVLSSYATDKLTAVAK
jgi:dihydroorotate dehydrogenase (fumarate)